MMFKVLHLASLIALVAADGDLGSFDSPPPGFTHTDPTELRHSLQTADITTCLDKAQLSLYHCCVYQTTDCDDLALDILEQNLAHSEATLQCSDIADHDSQTLLETGNGTVTILEELVDLVRAHEAVF